MDDALQSETTRNPPVVEESLDVSVRSSGGNLTPWVVVGMSPQGGVRKELL